MVQVKSIHTQAKLILNKKGLIILVFYIMELSMGQTNIATLGGGCFWCVEAVFQRINGVLEVKPGYAGGQIKNPTYADICTGTTGHAEVAQLKYDSSVVSFEEILDVFWHAHDPTTLNRQGNDKGTQYRSVIFYHDDNQKKIANNSLKNAEKSRIWPDPFVTEIIKINNYYDAEDYHKNYYNNNKNQPYCVFIITPKLKKLEKLGIIN